MIRRFNYTNRIDLPQSLFRFAISDGQPRTFTVEWGDIADYKFPPQAAIIVEAYSSAGLVRQRFAFGTVANRTPPSSTTLDELSGERVNFDVMVVDETQEVGKILGIARQIGPCKEGERQGDVDPLLPVNFVPLGRRVWKVNLRPEQGDGRPWLEVNREIPDVSNKLRHDRVFFALVYPEIVRVILQEILRREDFDLHGTDWRGRWLRWAVHWHPEHERPPDSAVTLEQDGERWVEEVVAGFCEQRDTLGMFIHPLPESAP
jgi:hypothetical protein